MSNGKFKMKYGDSISPGTFRADAPVQRFAPEGGTIKSYKGLGIPKYTGSSGAFGVIGGGAIKLGLGVVKKSLSNLKSFFKQTRVKAQQSARPVTKPKTFDYSKDFGKSYAETKHLGYGKPGYKWYGPPPTPKPSQSPSARLWRKHQQRVSDFNK